MKTEHFIEAIEVIATNGHSNEVVINYTKTDGQVPQERTLHIKSCTHSVMKKLMDSGFTLSLYKGLISINKY